MNMHYIQENNLCVILKNDLILTATDHTVVISCYWIRVNNIILPQCLQTFNSTYFKYLPLNTLFMHKPKDCVSDLDELLRSDLKAKYFYAIAILLKITQLSI